MSSRRWFIWSLKVLSFSNRVGCPLGSPSSIKKHLFSFQVCLALSSKLSDPALLQWVRGLFTQYFPPQLQAILFFSFLLIKQMAFPKSLSPAISVSYHVILVFLPCNASNFFQHLSKKGHLHAKYSIQCSDCKTISLFSSTPADHRQELHLLFRFLRFLGNPLPFL